MFFEMLIILFCISPQRENAAEFRFEREEKSKVQKLLEEVVNSCSPPAQTFANCVDALMHSF